MATVTKKEYEMEEVVSKLIE